MPANIEAWRIYQIAQSQVITAGMGDIIGIDFRGLDFVMELYGVTNRRAVFEKVIVLFTEYHRVRRDIKK